MKGRRQENAFSFVNTANMPTGPNNGKGNDGNTTHIKKQANSMKLMKTKTVVNVQYSQY